MSIKANTAFIIYKNKKVPLLKDYSEHSSIAASNILNNLGLKGYEADEIDEEDPEVFCETLGLRGDNIMIGAYSHGFIMDTELLLTAGTDEPCPLRDKILNIYGEGTVLFINLNGTFNYYAYALFEEGTLLRAKHGTLDTPVGRDYGIPLPAEKDARDGSHAALLVANAILGIAILGSENPYFPVLQSFYPS
jgi:hypothetical protein